MTTPTGHDECQCAACRVARAGLGPGPYTPEEYAKIAPPVLTVSDPGGDFVNADPDVIAAREKVALAREAWSAVERDYLARWVEVQQAALAKNRERQRRSGFVVAGDDVSAWGAMVDENDTELGEIRDRREAVGKALVRANTAERKAIYAARMRFNALQQEAAKPKPAPRRSRGLTGMFARG
jgi:hypothetical protein